jgi:hypothetical protein
MIHRCDGWHKTLKSKGRRAGRGTRVLFGPKPFGIFPALYAHGPTKTYFDASCIMAFFGKRKFFTFDALLSTSLFGKRKFSTFDAS